jgi:hypothetical protein
VVRAPAFQPFNNHCAPKGGNFMQKERSLDQIFMSADVSRGPTLLAEQNQRFTKGVVGRCPVLA